MVTLSYISNACHSLSEVAERLQHTQRDSTDASAQMQEDALHQELTMCSSRTQIVPELV